MVLHDLNQSARFADYIIALKEGQIIKADICEEVINHEVLKKSIPYLCHDWSGSTN